VWIDVLDVLVSFRSINVKMQNDVVIRRVSAGLYYPDPRTSDSQIVRENARSISGISLRSFKAHY